MNGVLVARRLVDLQKNTTALRVLNVTQEHKAIRRGATLASCEPVTSVTASPPKPAGEAGVVRMASPEDLPPHLQFLCLQSTKGLSVSEKEIACQLLCEFSDLFSSGAGDLGTTDLVKHEIRTGDAKPIRQPPRRLPLSKRKQAEEAIEEMELQGVIEPSASAWSSPVVLVTKKDGSTRFCVDYRRLNDVTQKDSYPLPRIDDTLDALAGARWFSTLDLKSGYWQVQLSDDAKDKTAFSTGTGLWQFNVMPFGLCNAPATFERLMEQVLAGLPTTIALLYLDDILVPGRTFDQQIANLRMVFQRLKSANLKLNPKKCALFQKEVQYLGHIVSAEGVAPDPAKIEAVKTWPRPSCVKDVKGFLGLASYYRRFIAGFADIAAPLHQYTQKESPFVWSKEAEDAFDKLKAVLTETPVLAYPDPQLPFILDTDASNTGIGAVLSQSIDGRERPVAFFSQTLGRAQRNYCVTRRELLAVVKSIRRFHAYLYGQRFVVRTDHSALQWLLNFRDPEGQVARWLETLQEYNFTVEHRPGSKHVNADAMSRRPCLDTGCRHCTNLESSHGYSSEQVRTVTLNNGELAGSLIEGSMDLQQAQQNDDDLRPVIEWLKAGTDRPCWEDVAPLGGCTKAYWAQWSSLQLVDGVLYRLWETPAGDKVIKQLVVPKTLREPILRELHSTITAGHFGVAKTIGRVRERFYWVNCRRDVQEWCHRCDVCAERKGPPRKQRGPMKQYIVGSPMECLALDIFGPLPVTDLGNK